MDTIYTYLKDDHKKVDELFKQFEKTKLPEAKQDYVNFLMKELLIHTESEQATFYKELEKHQKSEDEVLHGEKEHAEIESKMAEIVAIKTPNKAWEEKVKELQKLVEHHVSEEEGKIFRQAKKVISDERAYELREQMHDMKEKILTRLDKMTNAEEKNIVS